MDDSWSKFWERLVVDWVAVVVLAFVAQGIWFGVTSFLVGLKPDLEPRLVGLSSQLGIPWLGIISLGLLWSTKRAMDARSAAVTRR